MIKAQSQIHTSWYPFKCNNYDLCNSSTFIFLALRYLRTLLSASLKTSKFWKPTLVHHYLVKVRTSFFHKVKHKIETVSREVIFQQITKWNITFCKYNKTSNQLSKCLQLIYYLDTRKLSKHSFQIRSQLKQTRTTWFWPHMPI